MAARAATLWRVASASSAPFSNVSSLGSRLPHLQWGVLLASIVCRPLGLSEQPRIWQLRGHTAHPDSAPHRPRLSIPAAYGSMQVDGGTQWQRAEETERGSTERGSTRCLVCVSQHGPLGGCMPKVVLEGAADNRWSRSGVIQSLRGGRAFEVATSRPDDGRWLRSMTGAGTMSILWHDRRLHNPPAKSDNPQRAGLNRARDGRVVQGESGSKRSRLSPESSGWAAQDEKAVSAICRVLKAMRPSGEQVALPVDAALQPWARLANKYVLTGVLKQLKSDPSMALAFFRWAEKQPWYHGPNLHAYGILIGICGRANNFSHVKSLLEELLQQGAQPNIVTFTQLLNAYGRAGKWAEVDDIRSRMAAQGLPMNILTCCTLVDIYANAGFYSKAIEAFKAYIAAGGKPDIKLYSRLIWLYGQCGSAKGALEVLRQMKAAGCTPDLIAYNTLIDACGKAGRMKVALHLLEEMRRRGVPPDVVTYNTLVDLSGQNGMCEEAVRFFNDMQLKGPKPNMVTWTCMVSMWGRAGRPDRAQDYFDRMQEGGCLPNVLTYNSLLQAYLKGGMLPDARRVLLQLKSSHGASLDTYRMLLNAHVLCTKEQGWSEIWKLMELSGHHMHGRMKLLFQEEGARSPYPDRSMRADLDAVLESIRAEPLDLQRGLGNALVGFLWDAGRLEQAFILWELVRTKGLWNPINLPMSSLQTLALDFHDMAWNTAVVALMFELFALRLQALKGQPFVKTVELVTGRGNRSKVKGVSQVKYAVEQMVAAMGLPFTRDPSNSGCLVANGEQLKQWLMQPEVEEVLSFRGAKALKGCEPPLLENEV